MDQATQAALRAINRRFYDRCAADFDRTRGPNGWPGWRRVVEAAVRAQPADRPLRVLDLGCGNGRFARFLDARADLRRGRPFSCLGIDRSEKLLDRARAACAGRERLRFAAGDLETGALGISGLGTGGRERAFDLVVLFGVLHHLPGFDARRRALERAAAAVAPGGLLAVTCWQFEGAPRFENRRLDWALEPDVDPAQLEPGDHLLRWGSGGSAARRYCHHTGEGELDRLAAGLPLAETDRFRADGPGGKRNLYWLAATASRGRRSSWAETPR